MTNQRKTRDTVDTKATTMMTSEVAERAGVNLQTVHYYERRELIPEPPRTAAGYRQYDPGHVARIRFIKRAQEVGFTLGEVKELLVLGAAPEASKGEVKRHAEAKLADIEAKIENLSRMHRTLQGLIAACSGEGPTDDCPILGAFEAPGRKGQKD
jgi:DNA-binding transcriptional MerR regulator